MTLAIRPADPYTIASQEDRCAPRTRLSIPATLRPSGSTGFQIVVTDLSLGGFAAQALTGMHPGTLCWLKLPGLGGLQAEVIWNNGTTIGCAFADLLNQAVHDAIIARHG